MAQFRRNVRSPSTKGGSVSAEFFDPPPNFNPKIPLQRVAQFQRNHWLSLSGICNGSTVLKLNDAIYYANWVDYFHNLLLNNLFFPDTAYQLLGFHKDLDVLYAVVEQPFVKANEKTDLNMVKAFLENNGFINKKNHDYYNEELSLILEDLHDENVLTQNGMLYFIDTVFYIVSPK